MSQFRVLSMACLAMALLLFGTVKSVMAGGAEPFESIEVEALIRSCDDDPGETHVTTLLSQSNWREVDCLEKLALTQADAMFRPTRKFHQDSPWVAIKKLRKAYTSFYRELSHGHHGCEAGGTWVGCGTIMSVYFPAFVAERLEQLVRDMVEIRNRHRY